MAGPIRCLVVAACVAAVAVPAAAQDLRPAIAACATIDGLLQRLECFDEIARGLEGIGTEPGPADAEMANAGAGAWMTLEDINPLDDSQTVVLGLNSSNATSRFGEPVTLLLRCQSAEADVYIDWGSYLGSDAVVTTRLGTAQADTRSWNLSTDGQATFYPADAWQLITRLAGEERFIAQVTPYSEAPITAFFELAGLSSVVTPLFAACS